MMKAISLWQPWASLVATNWKHYETRSWQTPYRGLLAIHASKRTQDVEFWFNQPKFRHHLQASGYESFVDLPFGCLLGIVRLVNCVKTENIRHLLTPNEMAFGNYEDGRWAWELEFRERFFKPIPMRGAQGLFEVTV